jgi:serine phosphatase RsbU (regulator of sigma subunit)
LVEISLARAEAVKNTKSAAEESKASMLTKIKSLPIGVKIALLIFCLITILLVIFGVVAVVIAERVVEHEINQQGLRLLTMLNRSVLKECEGGVPLVFKKPESMAQDEWEYKRYKSRVEWCHTLKSVAGSEYGKDVVNIVISNDVLEGKTHQISANFNENFSFVVSGVIKKAGREGIKIVDGIYETKTQRISARRFSAPISFGKDMFGIAEIYLSLEKIAKTKMALISNIILIGAIALIVGTLLSIFLGRFISRPIKQLAKDMEIVSAGNLDHLSNIYTLDEVGRLASTFNKMTSALKVAREIEILQKTKEKELEIAAQIQMRILPQQNPDIKGFDFFSYYEPCLEVGGDLYDFIPIDDSRCGVFVADVSGKGVPAAIIGSMFKGFIRSEAEGKKGLSTSSTLISMNNFLCQQLPKGVFVTALYVIINPQDNTILISSAGHNPMLVYRHSTGEVECVNPSGIALGIFAGKFFDDRMAEESLILEPGDRVIMYTDGLTEMMNKEEEMFGLQRLIDFVKEAPAQSSEDFVLSLITQLERFRGEEELQDDITIVTFRVSG